MQGHSGTNLVMCRMYLWKTGIIRANERAPEDGPDLRKEFLSMQNNHRENTVFSDVCSWFKWKLSDTSFCFVSSIIHQNHLLLLKAELHENNLGEWFGFSWVCFSISLFLGLPHSLSLRWQACKCSYPNPPTVSTTEKTFLPSNQAFQTISSCKTILRAERRELAELKKIWFKKRMKRKNFEDSRRKNRNLAKTRRMQSKQNHEGSNEGKSDTIL